MMQKIGKFRENVNVISNCLEKCMPFMLGDVYILITDI